MDESKRTAGLVLTGLGIALGAGVVSALLDYVVYRAPWRAVIAGVSWMATVLVLAGRRILRG